VREVIEKGKKKYLDNLDAHILQAIKALQKSGSNVSMATIAREAGVPIITITSRMRDNEKVREAIGESREAANSQAFMDQIIIAMIEAEARGENIILGVGTGWIPAEEKGRMQGFLSSLRRLSRDDRGGRCNIIVRIENGGDLADELMAVHESDKTKNPLSNMIIINDIKTFGSG